MRDLTFQGVPRGKASLTSRMIIRHKSNRERGGLSENSKRSASRDFSHSYLNRQRTKSRKDVSPHSREIYDRKMKILQGRTISNDSMLWTTIISRAKYSGLLQRIRIPLVPVDTRQILSPYIGNVIYKPRQK